MTGNYYYINSTGLLTASSTFSGNNSFTGSNTFGAANGGATFTSPVSGSWATQTCYAQFKFPATTVNSIKRQIPIHRGSSDVSQADAAYYRYADTWQEFTGSGTPSDKFSMYMGQDGVIATRGALIVSPVVRQLSPGVDTGIAAGTFELIGPFHIQSTDAAAATMVGIRGDVSTALAMTTSVSGGNLILGGSAENTLTYAVSTAGKIGWGSGAVVRTGGVPDIYANQTALDVHLDRSAAGKLRITGNSANTGSLVVTGVVEGDRTSFRFGNAGTFVLVAGSASTYAKMASGVTQSATMGERALRAGSLITMSITAVVSVATTPGDIYYELVQDGTLVGAGVLTISSTGTKSARQTFSRGSSVFAATDLLAVRITELDFEGTITSFDIACGVILDA